MFNGCLICGWAVIYQPIPHWSVRLLKPDIFFSLKFVFSLWWTLKFCSYLRCKNWKICFLAPVYTFLFLAIFLRSNSPFQLFSLWHLCSSHAYAHGFFWWLFYICSLFIHGTISSECWYLFKFRSDLETFQGLWNHSFRVESTLDYFLFSCLLLSSLLVLIHIQGGKNPIANLQPSADNSIVESESVCGRWRQYVKLACREHPQGILDAEGGSTCWAWLLLLYTCV